MLGLLGVLAGCQEAEDEVSVRSENVGFAAEQTEKVEVEVNVKAAVPAPAGNPINASARTGIKPESLKIPAIGVNTSVQHLGTTENGEMAVPDDIDEVSWFSPGYQPGQNGRAVIAGHVDGIDGPAVFWDLSELQPGDEITVEGEGRQLIYKVHTMESVPLDEADVPNIFGYSSSPELVLITCSGTYDFSRGTREERLVVYASYVGE
ncbi:class F sortase [Planococcus koreensis]|nr:class F sortase [Planococcus koreensis]